MANKSTLQHPSSALLSAFGLGKLSGATATAVEQHVATCEVCCRELEQIADDPLSGLVRNAAETQFPQGPTLVPPEAPTPLPSLDASALAELPAELVQHPRYQITGVLGRGGMGVVYRAVHRLMERPVAIKLIRHHFLQHPQAEERFLREVKHAARLQHENIVAAYDAERAGTWHFLVMEYIEGTTLDRLVAQRGPLPVREACQLIRQAALGLQYAYSQGMVHRDIKPANMILTMQQQLKILDFGLARLAADDSSTGRTAGSNITSTSLGVVFGSPDYMSPEQTFDSRQTDIRSDLYSLGASLYFLLSGAPPFPHGDSISKVHAHRELPPPNILHLRNDVPPAVAAIVNRLMAKNPQERFQTPTELLAAIDAIPASAFDPRAKQPAAWFSSDPWAKRMSRRQWLWTGAGAAVAATALAYAATRSPRHTPTQFSLVGNSQATLPAGKLSDRSLLFVFPKEQVWTPDVVPVIERLRNQGGVRVVTASWETGICVPLPEVKQRFPAVSADVVVSRSLLLSHSFDGILIAGFNVEPFSTGHLAAEIKVLLDDFRQQKKLIAAICVGQAVLAQHGMLSGRQAAYGPFHQQNVPAGGARWQHDRPLVLDESGGFPLLTAASDASAVPWADAILKILSATPK